MGSAYSPRHTATERDGRGLVHDPSLRARAQMMAGPDGAPAAEAFLSLMACSRHVSEAMQSRAESAGLSLSRVVVLMRLRKSPGRSAAMHDLATWCNVSPRNVTGLVDGLEADGLVDRVADPQDRRVTLVRLTRAGQERADRYAPVHLAAMKAIFGTLSAEESSVMVDLCLRVADAALATAGPES